jgi:basic amino acid/polyamine antiporter, APA family
VSAEPQELRAAIGLPSAVMLVVGGVVGVGIFVNPAVVARDLPSPTLALAAWVVGGVVALLGALVYAELAGRIPSTGGEYQYLRAAYGPMAAFLFGWTTLLVVHTGGLAAVSIVFADNVAVLMGGGAPRAVIVLTTLAILAGINCLGVRSGNGTQAVLGALKVAAILAMVAAGLSLAKPVSPVPAPAVALGPKAFGAALIPVLFSYGGWQTANYVAGEIRDARRRLGLALLGGVIAVAALYLLVNIACLRALGIGGLARTMTPASDMLGLAAGPMGAKLAAAIVALSALAFMSQGMLTGPRVIFAMARDGLFFRAAARLGARGRAPAGAIILVAVWTGILALSGSYESILSYVTAMNFLFFGLTAAGLFVLRARDRGAEAFRTPLHPLTTGLFVAACAVVVASAFWSFPVDSLIGYAILAAGAPFYFWMRRRDPSLLASPPHAHG